MPRKKANEQQLDEFEASFGDPSTVPDPEASVKSKQAKAPGKSKNQEYDPEDPPTGVKAVAPAQADASVVKATSSQSKAGMLNTALKQMGKMTKEELESLIENLDQLQTVDEDQDDYEEVEYEFTPVTNKDIDLSNDIDAMFSEEQLTDDFKNKATTIFETAVVSKINEHLAEQHELIAHEYRAMKEELSEEVDQYLKYVVENWMEENKLAVEYGIRNEIAESFMSGLQELFTEHYINVPESEIDVVEQLGERVAELEEQLNTTVNENIEMAKELENATKADIFDEIAESLTDLERERFGSLVQNLEFKGAEDFVQTLETIKESYFNSSTSADSDVVVDDFDSTVGQIEEHVEEKNTQPPATNPHINLYAEAIRKSVGAF